MSERPKKRKHRTAEERAEILEYVAAFNAKHGRGGQAAAAKKYQLSAITVGTWMKKSGAGKKPDGSAGRLGGGNRRMARRTSPVESFAGKLRRLAGIHQEMVATESELNKLRAEYQALKDSL
jgi:hypothetical protein